MRNPAATVSGAVMGAHGRCIAGVAGIARMRAPILALLVAAASSVPVVDPEALRAEPVAEHERVPVDLRRTTLVVGDIERSLEFYRNALGMEVIYDNLITTPRGVDPDEAERALRLVLLRANDNYVGVLGLLQYFKPVKETLALAGTAFMEGTVVLVFNLEDLNGSFERATAVPGVVVLDEPAPVSYPSYDGEGTIEVLVSSLQDPDGFTVELNQLQEPLH